MVILVIYQRILDNLDLKNELERNSEVVPIAYFERNREGVGSTRSILLAITLGQ